MNSNLTGVREIEYPTISVVIPVYQCEAFLNELYQRLVKTIENITDNFEIIMVEDCGQDDSWSIIEKLSKADHRVKGIQFSRNFGQHHAITAGLDFTSGEWVVVMDGDLQDRPEEIIKLYKKALEGFDIVMACRVRRRDPLVQRVSSALFYKVFNYFTGMNYNPQVANFRIISKKVVVQIREMREQLRFFGGLVDWLGFPSAFVEVEHAARSQGKSTYTFRKKRRFAYEAIISYSDKPLKIAIQFGFLMALGAFVYGIYVVI